MAVNIHNLIAAISPDVFCDPSVKSEVKSTVKEKGYLEAANMAKPKESGAINEDKISLKNPMDSPGIKAPIEKHNLVYDSFGENLEPVYFWILDRLYKDYKVDKLVDNFISSPGSGHFSEIGQKATRMQEEGMKILGAANQVVKSILNLIYDLKEFKMRLDLYDQFRSKDKSEQGAANLSLKQIWMDTVDLKRGNTSIKALALGGQAPFVTLIDAFMAADSIKKIEELDLNDRVKRILQQRIAEYLRWLEESERELRKRYEIERTYLKSQVNTVYLYARWAKPYLKAARQLEQNAAPTAELVSNFNTVLFELVLLGKGEYKPSDDVNKGDLPKIFADMKLRKYMPIIIVELKFRSIPERAGQQGYGFRGKVDISFTSYALNEEEAKILKEQVEKDDFGDVYQMIAGATEDSLGQLKEDIDFFLKDLDESKSDSKKKDSDDSNPFSALFSFLSSSGKKEEKPKSDGKEIKSDSSYEKVVRSQAVLKAREDCKKLYDSYKKEHGMPAF